MMVALDNLQESSPILEKAIDENTSPTAQKALDATSLFFDLLSNSHKSSFEANWKRNYQLSFYQKGHKIHECYIKSGQKSTQINRSKCLLLLLLLL